MNIKITRNKVVFFWALSIFLHISAADALPSSKELKETDEITFYLEVVDDKLKPLEEVHLITMKADSPPSKPNEFSNPVPFSEPDKTIFDGKIEWKMKFNQTWLISLEKDGYYPARLRVRPKDCKDKLINENNCFKLSEKIILVKKGEVKLKEKFVRITEDYTSGVSHKQELTMFRPNKELSIENHLDIVLPISVDEFLKLKQQQDLPTYFNVRLNSKKGDGFILVDSELYCNIRTLTQAPKKGYQKELKVDLKSENDTYGYFKFNGIYGKMRIRPKIVPGGAIVTIFFFYPEWGGRNLRSPLIDKVDDW